MKIRFKTRQTIVNLILAEADRRIGEAFNRRFAGEKQEETLRRNSAAEGEYLNVTAKLINLESLNCPKRIVLAVNIISETTAKRIIRVLEEDIRLQQDDVIDPLPELLETEG